MERMPKPEKTGPKSERIRFKKDGVEYSMTPEEYEAHVKKEARTQELEKREKEGGALRNLIDAFKATLKTEKPEPPEDDNGEEKREAA